MCRWTLLLQAPGRVGERRAGDERARPAGAELAREQVRAGEAQRVGDQEQQVVAGDGRVHAFADEARGRVADERVGDRKAVAHRPERVGLKEAEGLRLQRVPVPGDLPRLHERVAEILRDDLAEVQRQRPVHHEREHDRERDGAQQLAGGQVGRGRGIGVHAAIIYRILTSG